MYQAWGLRVNGVCREPGWEEGNGGVNSGSKGETWGEPREPNLEVRG